MEISRIHAQRTRWESAQQRLERLMPFDEWCRAVHPTQTAKEMYEFVRSTLEHELERSRRVYVEALGERTSSSGRQSRIRRPC
jgi:hypothetical protein